MCVLCDSDWRDVLEDEHQENSPQRKKAKTTADDFYKLLKESIKTDKNITFDQTDYTNKPTSLEEGFKRIKNIFDVINIHKTDGMNFYCLMGAELAYVKYLQFATKCSDKCLAEVDMYSVLACTECINKNKSKVTNYFKQVHAILSTSYAKTSYAKTSYSKSHINFLISLAKLCLMYPKLKFTYMPLNQIKIHMNCLRHQISLDVEFWKVV